MYNEPIASGDPTHHPSQGDNIGNHGIDSRDLPFRPCSHGTPATNGNHEPANDNEHFCENPSETHEHTLNRHHDTSSYGVTLGE